MISLTSSFAEAEALTINRFPVDTLILDLDGDGIETTTLENRIYFDHETDWFAEKSSWAGSNIIMFDKYYIKQTA